MEQQANNEKKPVIGITMGDINGVGPELIMKLVANPDLFNLCDVLIYGNNKVLNRYRKILDFEHLNYNVAQDPKKLHHKKANVFNCWQEDHQVEPGNPTPLGGQCALQALEQASEHLKAGLIDGLVTGPINKKMMPREAFASPGHTEYFAQKFDAEDSLMLMVSGKLKIAVATGHIPLKEVPQAITPDLLRHRIAQLRHSLEQDFGHKKPKIAVLGLNPHAGEEGLLGQEEQQASLPLVGELKEQGQLVYGPLSADGFFGAGEQTKFDGILAMYHDQGLVPFKALSFGAGVNFTAGLPVVRTSPDHGTAYALAGKGQAQPDSLRNALFTALEIIKTRKGERIELAV